MRQQVSSEKKAFVASGTHKKSETVTDRAHLAALAFLQMREGVERTLQFSLEDFASWIARQSVAPEQDAHRHFERCEAASDPGSQLLFGRCRTRFQLHDRSGLLAQHAMRNADERGIHHGRMLEHNVLDFD